MAFLDWSTSSEQNSDRFEILHSTNGRDFSKLGEIKASGGSSTLLSYQFTHPSPISGWNYYRLRMTDIDGQEEFSEVRRIHLTKGSAIQILPNPARDVVRVRHTFMNAVKIHVTDMSGRLVKQFKTAGNEISIDISSLAPGTYSIVLKSGEEVLVQQFVKE